MHFTKMYYKPDQCPQKCEHVEQDPDLFRPAVSPIPKIPKCRAHGTDKIEDGDDAINAGDVLLGNHILSTEKALYDKHGPGELEVDPPKAPVDVTPAQWAKHCISYLITLVVAYVWRAND